MTISQYKELCQHCLGFLPVGLQRDRMENLISFLGHICSPLGETIRINNLQINLLTHEITSDDTGKSFRPTSSEFPAALAFLASPGIVLTVEDVMQCVLKRREYNRQYAAVVVHRLNRKFDNFDPNYHIVSVRRYDKRGNNLGRGYVLKYPVRYKVQHRDSLMAYAMLGH